MVTPRLNAVLRVPRVVTPEIHDLDLVLYYPNEGCAIVQDRSTCVALPCPRQFRCEAAAEVVDGPADDDVVVERDVERDEDGAVPDALKHGFNSTFWTW